jgi:curved DNA-binding protein CbpA
MFKEVGEAYSILGDGAKRVQYDGLRAGPRVVQMPPQSVATVNVNGQEISGALAELLLALMQQSRDVVRRNPSFVEILAEKMGLVKRRRKVISALSIRRSGYRISTPMPTCSATHLGPRSMLRRECSRR